MSFSLEALAQRQKGAAADSGAPEPGLTIEALTQRASRPESDGKPGAGATPFTVGALAQRAQQAPQPAPDATAGPASQDAPLIQRGAQALLGIEPQPVPSAPAPRFIPPERPAAVRTAEQMQRDLRESAKFAAGLRAVPKGNLPAKVEALRRDVQQEEDPIQEKSLFELAADIPANAIDELREIPKGLGLLLGQGARNAGDAFVRLAGMMTIDLPDPETGELGRIRLPGRRVQDLDPQMVDALVRMGARFGPEPFEESAFDAFLETEARRLGFVEPGEVPEDATTFRVPLVDSKVFSPRVFAEETSERPITRLLDLALAGRLPSIGARTGASGSRAAARTGARLGAREVDATLTRVSIKLDEFADRADAVMSIAAVRALARKGAELSPAGRRFLESHDARKLVRSMIRENTETSFARRRSAEVEIHRALRDLSDDEVRLLPTVLEGRALIVEGQMTPQLDHALNVVKANIRKSQAELIDLGALRGDTAANRAFAPLVVVRSGKRIPGKEWDAAKVARENRSIQLTNRSLPDHQRVPEFMGADEYERLLTQTRREWEQMQSNLGELPNDANLAPTYFPRFATEPTVRDVLREFFPSAVRMPGREPFQRQFTGASLLREADPRDVERALLEHNARVRRLVDGTKAVEALKEAPFTKSLQLDAKGNPTNLLPDHVAFNPDGTLQFFRKQLDLTEETARALERMGDFESALAEGVRNAFPDGLSVQFAGVAKRQQIFQIPRGAAKELEATFRPTSPATRILWDSPTDAWKAGVLAFSPRWHVNNLVGGLVLGTMAGVPAHRLVKPLSASERAAIPARIEAQTLTFSEGFRPRLAALPKTLPGRLLRAVANTAPLRIPFNAVRRFRDASFGFNTAVDTHFRSRVYLEQARKTARNQLVKETGSSLIKSRDLFVRMEELAKNPATARQLLESTDRVFFNFNRLTPHERRYVRRVIPFWTWYREISRVTLTLPETMPGRAQALRSLSQLGAQSDDLEVRRHLGIPKKFLPEYLRDQVFVGLDNDGNVTFLSPRGMNVFHGSTIFPLGETQGRLHPAIQLLIEESTGGRTIGRWGNYVPFRFEEAGKRFALDAETGELVEKSGGRAIGKRIARTVPLTNLLENLVQFATEGKITQRFDDVTPLSNLIPAATGGRVTPTSVPSRSEELAPRREKSLGQVAAAFAGVSTSRYRLLEILENEVKNRSQDAGTIFVNKFVSDPEFRELFEQVLQESRGEPFQGVRTFSGPEPN